MGSASELEYHLLLARDLGYLGKESYEKLAGGTQEVKRMLSRLINSLRPNNLSNRREAERLTD